MTLTKQQTTHIETYGEAKFAEVLARCAMVVRTDSRLVGLDQIRRPLELYSALKATGFEVGYFTAGAKLELTSDMREICQEIADRAVATSKKRKKKAA